jgi:hypothetical protein
VAAAQFDEFVAVLQVVKLEEVVMLAVFGVGFR